MSLALNLLTVAALLFGLFFMLVGAAGLWRLPDFYSRMHAGSKCLTLGLSGMMLAAVFHLANPAAPAESAGGGEGVASAVAATTAHRDVIVGVITKSILVILFQFVAAPVGAHMLSRGAHLDGAYQWKCEGRDELEDDRKTWD